MMVAYLRGVRDYKDAFVRRLNRDAIVDILIRRTTLTDRSLYDQVGFPALDPNGGVLAQDLQVQQDWYVDNGYQNARVDINTTVDHQFAEFAVSQLGTYTA